MPRHRMGSTLYTKRYHPNEGRHRGHRPQTFATADAAKAWAEKNKVKKFEIVPMTYTAKCKLVIR
jgi:hypothetical protein